MIKGKETVRNFIKPHFWRSCVCSSRVSHGRSHTALPWSIFHKTHECREICRAKDAQSYHEKGRFLKSPAASLTTFDRRICQLCSKKIAKCLLFFSAKTRMSTRKHQSHCAAARRFDPPFPWTKVDTKKTHGKSTVAMTYTAEVTFSPGKNPTSSSKICIFPTWQDLQCPKASNSCVLSPSGRLRECTMLSSLSLSTTSKKVPRHLDVTAMPQVGGPKIQPEAYTKQRRFPSRGTARASHWSDWIDDFKIL